MRMRLVILAWVHIVIGGAGLAVFAALLGGFLLARDPEYNDEFVMLGGVLGVFSLFYFAPMFLGGVGLLLRKAWGRALLWSVSPFLALATPVGTLLAGYNLWALLTTAGFSNDSMARAERIIRNALRNIVLILIALFILGLIVGIGWLFRDQIDPPREQILTPIPEMPNFEQPEFKPPEFNLPERPGEPE